VTQNDPVLANALSTAVVNIDLQLYKGSIYRLRWGSPGGLDMAVPAYREAKKAVDGARWPDDLAKDATLLSEAIDQYLQDLDAMDVTTANADNTRMMQAFETLRDSTRSWADAATAD
jgi:hypothetical protein